VVPPGTPLLGRTEGGCVTAAAFAALVALVAGGITASLIVILHVVEPEYDPSWRMISEYSLGRHGWLMRIAFTTMAISSAAICVALWPFAGAWSIGLVLVGAGALGAAFVDADPITTARADATSVGRAHSALGIILLIGFPLAATFAAIGAADAFGWTLAIASVVPWAALTWFLRVWASARGRAGSPAVPVGWPDRACVVADLGWVALAAALVLSW
jgi:hypothetical protein